MEVIFDRVENIRKTDSHQYADLIACFTPNWFERTFKKKEVSTGKTTIFLAKNTSEWRFLDNGECIDGQTRNLLIAHIAKIDLETQLNEKT